MRPNQYTGRKKAFKEDVREQGCAILGRIPSMYVCNI